jgi:hypothetical protein
MVTTDDTIIVTSDSRYSNSTAGPNLPITQIVSEPDHLYVTFSTTDIITPKSASITPNPIINGNWEVNLSTINQSPSLYNILTIKILKNGNPTVSNLIINNSILAGNSYQIDLADNAYGLKESFVYPFDLNIVPKSGVTCTQTGYQVRADPNIISHNMGSLEYHSNNNYWIAQNYIYQYGGVFLQQDNGGVVKLLPSITIDSLSSNVAKVTIHDITIPVSPIPSRVGGSSLVEVLTTLQKPTTDPTLLAPGAPNARWVNITINARDAATAQMWKDTLSKIRQNSNVPNTWISPPVQSGNYVWMNITGSSSNNYDILLETLGSFANIYLSPTSY